MMETILIAAVAENRVIGKDGEIPWYYPEDLEHFREETTGHPVIMGSTTYRSIEERLDGPLPDRYNIVLSHEEIDVPEEVYNAHSIEEALDEAAEHEDTRVFVAGGASVYRQFMEDDLADRMVLTEIKPEYDGDTRFPEWDESEWREVEREEREEFDFVEYVKEG